VSNISKPVRLWFAKVSAGKTTKPTHNFGGKFAIKKIKSIRKYSYCKFYDKIIMIECKR
jgi:hypothetical protein